MHSTYTGNHYVGTNSGGKVNDYDYEDDFEQYEPSPYNGDDPDEGPLVVDEVDQDWFDDADWDDEEVEILGDEDFIYDDLDAPY